MTVDGTMRANRDWREEHRLKSHTASPVGRRFETARDQSAYPFSSALFSPSFLFLAVFLCFLFNSSHTDYLFSSRNPLFHSSNAPCCATTLLTFVLYSLTFWSISYPAVVAISPSHADTLQFARFRYYTRLRTAQISEQAHRVVPGAFLNHDAALTAFCSLAKGRA